MWVCVLCGDRVTRDDAECPTLTGKCICVRCYAREIRYELPRIKPAFIDDVEEVLRKNPLTRE